MNSKRGKRLWGLLAAVAGIGVILCLWLLLRPGGQPDPPVKDTVQPQLEDTQSEAVQVPDVPPEDAPPEESGEVEPVETVEVPVDFDALREQNPDIYAWIQFPGTPVDYPVLQRFGDDEYYLRRDVEGNQATAGSLFTEYRYNNTDFRDPVTIIYGHNMRDGSMFGSLQTYNETLTLDEDAVFYIYQPGRKLTYRIFAAVPYDNSHILYYNDFRDENAYTGFFERVYETRSLYANLDPESEPAFGDKVVILATCLKGDSTKRFLVMGVLTEDVSENLS